MDDCIFCKIINKDIPAEIVFESDQVICFKDINPKAKVHLLVIPKKHIPTINDLANEDRGLISELIFTAKEIANKIGLSNGYKLVFNVGKGGGQEVFHIHLHILG